MENELQPQLEQAVETLASALSAACKADVRAANTGELIGIEEKLAIAATAAKAAVSVRLRRRKSRELAAEQAARRPADIADVIPAVSKREFDDLGGKRWRVFAVRPSRTTVERAALPDSFIGGWLSFESGNEKRRVAPIPEGWENLAVGDLQLLCQRAQPAPKRTSKPLPPPGQS